MDKLLDRLKSVFHVPEFSRENILSAIKDVLEWLNHPQNNTDANCRKVDYFVSSEIMFDKKYQEMPEDIKALLFDVGGALHDTHASPEIAENFESTPKQLLDRTRKLLDG